MKRALIIFLTTAAVLMSACAVTGGTQDEYPVFSTFRDIPGVTEQEIAAIEALQQNRSSFVYAMDRSVECFYGEDGRIEGFAALMADWLSSLFEIPFEIAVCEWDALLSGLEAHTIDFSSDFTSTPERLNIYYMTTPVAMRSVKMMRLAGSRTIDEIAQTGTVRYIFLDGSVTYEQVLPFLNEPYSAAFADNLSDVYMMLSNGEADAYLEESPYEAAFDEYGDVIAEEFFPLIYTPVSLTTRNPELRPIIDVVQKALDAGAGRIFTQFYNEGYNTYSRYKFFSQLSDAELAYIDDKVNTGTAIPIGVEFDNYPTSFYNTNERAWQGVALDVLSEISDLTGLRFEVVHDTNTNFSDLMIMLIAGEIFILSEVIPTPEREGWVLWSEPYASDYYALLSRMDFKDIEVNEILSLRVGTQRGSANAEVFMQWFPDHPNIVEYEDALTALGGLELGEIDAFMGSRKILMQATNYLENPGFKSNIVFNRTYDSTFGVNTGEPVLLSIIDKAGQIIDTNTINERWMTRVFDYQNAQMRERMPYLIGLSVLLLGVVGLLVIMFERGRRANAVLEAAVAERTRELKEQMEIAVSASESKSRFLATMSHEIRTPMNVILGITQSRLQNQNGDMPPEYASAFERINDSGSSLLRIINDILDLSKIETGKMELSLGEYESANLINDAVRLNMVRIGEKPIEFILDVTETLPARLYGDELRIKQILNNLLSNAIKYTEQGYVKLAVRHFVKDDTATLVFTVEDTGQGIRPEDCKRLFSEEYLRFNSEANRTAEGTGLGLSIASRLAEMMDGAIGVESEYGKGSIFTVTVKQRLAGSGTIGAQTAESLRCFEYKDSKLQERSEMTLTPMPYGKVLIVDDVESNLYVAKEMLLPYELSIETVNSGFKALEKVEGGARYDVIFMDHMMPKMDGIETTRRLRELGYKGAVVALTANALAGSEQMFEKSGFDGFIPKPIDAGRLDDVLSRHIRDKHGDVS